MGWIRIKIDTDPVESPCIGVCSLDDAGYCMGCRRSAEEIGDWLNYSEEQRREIMDSLEHRE